MKTLMTIATLAFVLTGCNAMTAMADKAMDKQSSFSQEENTIYPTVNGAKDAEPAQFGKQSF